MIVENVVHRKPVPVQNAAKRSITLDDRARAVLGRLLYEIIALQKIHYMRKHRRGDVVQKPRDRLLFIVRKMPHDQRDAETVIKARIRLQVRKPRERRVFTAAVHADMANPLHARRVCAVAYHGGYFAVIDAVMLHKDSIADDGKAVNSCGCAAIRFGTPWSTSPANSRARVRRRM